MISFILSWKSNANDSPEIFNLFPIEVFTGYAQSERGENDKDGGQEKLHQDYVQNGAVIDSLWDGQYVKNTDASECNGGVNEYFCGDLLHIGSIW